MGNLTKPVIGMIGLLSKVMFYWVPDGKQSKLIKTKIKALRLRRSGMLDGVKALSQRYV